MAVAVPLAGQCQSKRKRGVQRTVVEVVVVVVEGQARQTQSSIINRRLNGVSRVATSEFLARLEARKTHLASLAAMLRKYNNNDDYYYHNYCCC